MYNNKNNVIFKKLTTDIQSIERIARIMNINNSIYDEYQNQMFFQSKVLFSDNERNIVSHMCLRLADQMENNNKEDFIRLRFNRFICMILEDMEIVLELLDQIANNSLYSMNTRLQANGYKKLVRDQRNQLVNTSFDRQLSNTCNKDREKSKFYYDVPTAFLILYGIARQIHHSLFLKKYEPVMPELMQLLEEK
ncbi:hypothetical protein ACIQYL_20760 [Lysinibacillus xylanilyticus]|uniref:hypothetical protein n=1 Tax=Lysinibacillus xylanilyticus TaxID=582475 RepID=UPI003818F829